MHVPSLHHPNLSNTSSMMQCVNNNQMQASCHTCNSFMMPQQPNPGQPYQHQSECLQYSQNMCPIHDHSNMNSCMFNTPPFLSSQQYNHHHNVFKPITKSIGNCGNLHNMKTDLEKRTKHAKYQKIVKLPPHPNKFLSPPKCLRMKKMVSDDEFGSNYFELSWKSQKKKKIRKRKQASNQQFQHTHSNEFQHIQHVEFQQESFENHKESVSSSDDGSFLCISSIQEVEEVNNSEQQIAQMEENNCPWNALFPLKLVFDE